MNSNSQETLRRIEQNDVSCKGLTIGYSGIGGFKSSDAGDYSRLGAAIGDNTHLKKLWMNLGNGLNQAWTRQTMSSSMASNKIHLLKTWYLVAAIKLLLEE